jgi:hypothetical protein
MAHEYGAMVKQRLTGLTKKMSLQKSVKITHYSENHMKATKKSKSKKVKLSL